MIVNLKGKLTEFDVPVVMGILNATPDSFYDGGKFMQETHIANRIGQMLAEGAAIIDIGGMSSRPGAQEISLEEEWERLKLPLEIIQQNFSDAIISVDTYRAEIAKRAVENGASIINDISAGRFDAKMLETVARLKVPYILMHMQGTPANMQQNPIYENVLSKIIDFFNERVSAATKAGIKDIIIDPGFGFGKSLDHNYILLKRLSVFKKFFRQEILVGVSRKSMVNKVLGTKPENALNGTTALHMLALNNGATLLRAHDVKEAVECVKLFKEYSKVDEKY